MSEFLHDAEQRITEHEDTVEELRAKLKIAEKQAETEHNHHTARTRQLREERNETQQRLSDITAALPATYYADREISERVAFIVKEWQKLVPLVQKLQEQRDDYAGRINGLEEELEVETCKLASELEKAQEKLNYVHKMGLRFGMMTSSDKPEPYLAHVWAEDSAHERMFKEWSHSIGWEDRLKELEAQRNHWKGRVELAESNLSSRNESCNALISERDDARKLAIENAALVQNKQKFLEEAWVELEKVKKERDKAIAAYPACSYCRGEIGVILTTVWEQSVSRTILKEVTDELNSMSKHTRYCSFDNATGDEGDYCTCGLSERRKIIARAQAELKRTEPRGETEMDARRLAGMEPLQHETNKDKERLDWLEASERQVYIEHNKWRVQYSVKNGDNLRVAIDEAMK